MQQNLQNTPLKTAAPMESHAATVLTPDAFCKLQEKPVLVAPCIISGERLLSGETPYKNCPGFGRWVGRRVYWISGGPKIFVWVGLNFCKTVFTLTIVKEKIYCI